jgi:hypothetical protein
MRTPFVTAASVLAAAFATAVLAQSASHCSAHHAGVESRGDHVMGFDHQKTTHHFRLTPRGGVIEVTANVESDAASRDAIREHLSHIAVLFAGGDFEAPMLIHDRVPPGVPVLKAKGKAIGWTYVESPQGGQVLIVTEDPEARAAIHEFLRFQIEDHQTGDTLEVADDTKAPGASASKPRS